MLCCKLVLTFQSVGEFLRCLPTSIPGNVVEVCTEQYFPVVLIILQYKVVLTFKSVTV